MKALTWSSVNCRVELEAENCVGLFTTSLLCVLSQVEPAQSAEESELGTACPDF